MADPIFGTGVEGGDPYYTPPTPQAAPVYAVEAPLAPDAPVSIDPNRGAALTDLPMNFAADVKDMAKGLFEMASIPVARIYEAASGNGALIGRPSDPIEFGNFVSGIIDQYKTTYFDPFAQGRPGDILQTAIEHPVQILGDAIPAAQALKVPKMLGAGVSAVAKTEQGLAATKAASDLAKRLYSQLETTAPAVGDLISGLKADTEFAQPVRKELMTELQSERRTLRPLFEAMPAAERKIIHKVLDGRIIAPQGALSKEAQAYIAARRALNSKMANWLIGDGLATAEQIELNRWIPAVLQKFGGKVSDYPMDTLKKLVEEVKADLTSRGVDPTYVPWMTEGQVKRSLSTSPWKIPDKLAHIGVKNASKGATVETPGFAKGRKGAQKDTYHDNDLELALARHTDVSKYHIFFRNLIDRAIKLGMTPEDFTKLSIEQQKHLAPFNLRQFFLDTTKHIRAMSDEFSKDLLAERATIVATLPEVTYLPKDVAKVLSGATARASLVERAVKYAAGFSRRYMLGTSPLYPEKQAIQNEVMLFTAQFQGPQDIVKSIASHILASNKEVRASIPAALLADEAAIVGAEAGMLPTKVGAAVDKFVDFTFKRAAKYDNLFRTKATIYYALRMSEKLGFKPLLVEMCSVGDAINRLQAIANDPITLEQLAKRVNNLCGDYSTVTMNTGIRQHLRTSLLWYAWYEHIVRYAYALPASNPYKMSIMNHMAQLMPTLYDDNSAPEYLREAGAVRIQGKTNPQGLPEYAMASSMSPFGTLPELFAMVTTPFNEKAGDGAGIFSAINPIFSMAIALIGKKNPQSMRDFSNPDLYKFQGKQYHPEDVAAGKDAEEVHPVPNAIELLGRQTFSWPTRTAERIYAKATQDAEPSQFTVPMLGQAAPKRVSSQGYAPMAADDWHDIGMQMLLGFRALPIDDQAEAMRQIYEPKQHQQMYRSYIRQFSGRKSD